MGFETPIINCELDELLITENAFIIDMSSETNNTELNIDDFTLTGNE